MLYINSLLDVICFTDPASGKRGEQLKRARARMAAVVVGQDVIGRIFVLHAWADRVTTPEYIEHLFQINDTWHPKRFGVEANGMQVTFGDTVQMIAQMRGKTIPFEPIWQPTNVTKEWRNRTRLQPALANGRLFLQENQHELKAELLGHPNYPTVDLVDALATAVDMLPSRSHQNQARENDLGTLAQYLRESGAKPSYIQKRMQELRLEQEEHELASILLPLVNS
jgi:hypothetical protein